MPVINISTWFHFCEHMCELGVMNASALVELDKLGNHNISHVPVKWCARFMERHRNA